MKISKIRINRLIIGGILLTGIAFTSCKKSSDDPSLPPVGGFNGSSDVGKANLVAHWGFEGDGKEEKSGATPVDSKNSSFITGGIKGQALKLDSGYLHYNEITALNSLPSFTVSAWVNVKNNGKFPIPFFTITRPGNPWNGSVNLFAETFKINADTMKIKGLFVANNNGDENVQDDINSPELGGDQAFKGEGKWSHVVIVYDAASSNFYVYGNGIKINNPLYEHRTIGANKDAIGSLKFFTPSNVVIGAWGSNLPGATADTWQKPMAGQIDEIRVWNTAISAADIKSLYQLELAGR